MNIEILHRDDIPLGGFAGLKEHRLVMDPKMFGSNANPGTWPGIENFVYLADARFDPKGETEMHSHQEIDVISVMVDGRIAHEGSMESGQGLEAFDIQVQRAGGEGFSHNEVNPDDTKNRMIQIWALPEKSGESAGYKLYRPQWGDMVRVYGGPANQNDTFDSHTVIEVGLLNPGQSVQFKTDFLAYITQGKGKANGMDVADGDLLRGGNLEFEAIDKTQLIVVHS